MEENIKIMLLGQEMSIPREAVMNFQTLITEQIIKEIRFPYCMCKFQTQLNVLHSCLYYLIVVEKNLSESHSLVFREKCITSLSEYYIKRKMNFQLYEYGYLCGKILSIPIDKAMHIIYFLVYTRLASKPFIDNIITQMERKRSQSKKKTTVKSEKEFSIQSKSHDSRHLTIFYEPHQMESEMLRKELHKIMSPHSKESKKMTKKVENKRYFNLKKVYPDENDLREEKQCEYRSTATSRIVNIPVKVACNENSSVIARLKLKSNVNQGDSQFKKIQIRRQKFNEWFDSGQKYMQIMSECDQNDSRKPQWGTSKNIIERDQKSLFTTNYKSQKHPYEYYQDIASSIRNKNDQLDSIRHECFHHNDKNAVNCHKEPTYRQYFGRGFMLNRHILKTESSKIERVPENFKKIQTNREVVKENYTKQDNFCLQSDKENYGKLSKTASVSKFSESALQDHISSIITRKNDSLCTQQENLMLFNRKIKNKFKLQKYKQQFRHFLKTQVFQRVQQNSG